MPTRTPLEWSSEAALLASGGPGSLEVTKLRSFIMMRPLREEGDVHSSAFPGVWERPGGHQDDAYTSGSKFIRE